MKIKNTRVLKSCIFLSLLVLSSCRQPIQNLYDVKEQIEHYYECGQYDKDVTKIVNKTIKHFSHKHPKPKSVIIFDIDDTVLSDYSDQKSISFGYIPKLSDEWVLEADAPAIPQMKKLYDYLVNRGFGIIFLTGRLANQYDATEKNLKREGYTQFEKLIVRPTNEKQLSAQEYKSRHRAQLVKEGYIIEATIGDQLSDLKGGNAGYQVKIPNHRYKIQ